MSDALISQFQEELAHYNIACDETAARLMVGHLELLFVKNETLNLTRITKPSEAVTLHLVDSLLPLATRALREHHTQRFLDMGTGGGFPGIPFGIMTKAEGTLIDSVGKKVAAVSEFISALGLSNLAACHDRVEDFARSLDRPYDVVLARAVAQANVLVEYASPLLAKGGYLVIEKGRPSDEEITCAKRAAKLCGLSLVSRDQFELPRELGHREVLIFEKTHRATLKLPRKTGLAKKEPLGCA